MTPKKATKPRGFEVFRLVRKREVDSDVIHYEKCTYVLGLTGLLFKRKEIFFFPDAMHPGGYKESFPWKDKGQLPPNLSAEELKDRLISRGYK